MAGITPFVTAALPLATSVVNATSARRSAASATSAGSASAAAAAEANERELALQADYARQEREQEARLRQEEQERAWRREDELRRQEEARRLQQADQERIAAEQARAREMNWLSAGQNQTAAQLRAGQEAELRTREADAGNRLAQARATAETDERRRVDALRRAMGRSRASLGAQGVSSADGSGEAILLGLVGDSAAERRESQDLDRIRRQAVQQELDDRRRLNLLEQAQLAERQRLEFLSRFY
ncbi:hypothetical protein [Azospirillum sp. SYSU D00513]|uniref:hypothetical protein n=1 Tax=Azospirillum sp. SYSU D00513 TaxID=2812561 RepID=UPI001A9594D4|nr:hypothetical protein [Azospirillum sp. SYSU D00513]